MMRVFISCCLLIMITACTANGETETVNPYRVVYGLPDSVSRFDPHISDAEMIGIVLRQVYDTLVYRHPETKQIVPGLANSWTISDDGLIYNFTLRENVVFHDGSNFNAEAVARNIQRITTPATASQRARSLLGPIRSYQVIDDYTFRITLSEPYTPLLDALAQPFLGIASPQALDEYNDLRYQFHQIGTGPFEMIEYIPERVLILRRNPNYAWGPDFYVRDVPDNAIQEIDYRFYLDETQRGAAILNGEADIVTAVLPEDGRALANDDRFELLPVNIPGQPLQFYMNTQNPPIDRLAVRQALLFATNRAAIADAVFQSFSPIAWGPLSADALYYNPSVVGVYGYNLTQAQALLEGAGYADTDRDGILDLNGEPLEIRIIQPAWQLIPEVTENLTEQWRAIGVRVVIDPVPSANAMLDQIREGEYHLVADNVYGFEPAYLSDHFISNSLFNWSGYSNPELDQLLMDAARATNPETRLQMYGRAQAIIMQQALVLPIRDHVVLNAYDLRLQNLAFDPYGWYPLMHNVTVLRR